MNTHHSWSIGKITGIVTLFAAAFISYGLFATSPTQQVAAAGEAVVVDNSPSTDVVGKELLVLLDKIESLKLDGSIFNDKTFLSLQDYSVTLVPQNPGRSNPFAPLPGTAPAKTTKTTKTTAR